MNQRPFRTFTSEKFATALPALRSEAVKRFPASQQERRPQARARQASLFPDESAEAGEDSTAEESKPAIFTIGHSTRRLEELIAALQHYRIERLVDIRHFPSSRHNPQFNREVLEGTLPQAGMEYLWLERLGGYREGGYLAYMQRPEFLAGIEELEKLAREKRSACMCAEVKWFQCHRRHVSDVLTERGWAVTHVWDEKRADRHYKRTTRIKCD